MAQAVQEYSNIRQAVDDIVNAKEKVVLETLGYFESDSGDSEDDDSSDSQSDCESNQLNTACSRKATRVPVMTKKVMQVLLSRQVD